MENGNRIISNPQEDAKIVGINMKKAGDKRIKKTNSFKKRVTLKKLR